MAFQYNKLECRFIAHYKDGKWDEGKVYKRNLLTISEASTAINYGQQCFEGLKAYKNSEGKVHLFRPELNAKRMQESCERLLMPSVPTELFLKGCETVIQENSDVIPEEGSGDTLYLRPLVIGVGDKLGVGPAPEYMFIVFGSVVGPYFSEGFKPLKFCTTDYDRAAYSGTGKAKVGGNYAASLLAKKEAVEKGFDDCIYLDPITHTKIEEVGAANFFGITADNCFVTPTSPSILNSITKQSLMVIAEKSFGMKVQERDCYIDKIEEFIEAGACGTAAVISAIEVINHKGKETYFSKGHSAGPIITSLYNKINEIYYGKDEAYLNWLHEVKVGK